MWELFTLTLCMTLLFGFVFYLLLQSLFGVPYVPSSAKAAKAALQQLDLQGKKFVDLGSGDGLIVITAARLGAQAHGVEINPVLVWASRIRAGLRGVKTNFRHGSFTEYPLHDVDVVYLYLLPQTLEKLLPKLQQELKPGSIVISNTFKFPQLQPEQELNKQFLVYRIQPSSE